MRVLRLRQAPGFNIDRAAAAGDDPDVLRIENLEPDARLPEAAIAAARDAMGQEEASRRLLFTGVRVRAALAAAGVTS